MTAKKQVIAMLLAVFLILLSISVKAENNLCKISTVNQGHIIIDKSTFIQLHS